MKKQALKIPRPFPICLPEKKKKMSAKSSIPDLRAKFIRALSAHCPADFLNFPDLGWLNLIKRWVGDMLPIKPDSKVLAMAAVIEQRTPGIVHFGSSCSSISPKFHELLARCDAARGIEQPDTGGAVKPHKTGG